MANPFDEFDDAPAAVDGPNPFDEFDDKPQQSAQPKRSLMDTLVRDLALGARGIGQGIAGALAAPADAVLLYGRAKLGPYAYQGPTAGEMINRGLNEAGAPQPVSDTEQFVFGLNNVAGGAITPMPKGAPFQMPTGTPVGPWGASVPQTPSNFVSPAAMEAADKAMRLRAAQDAGYVVPPAQTNPTWYTHTMQGAAGKLSVQQKASQLNEDTTGILARGDLGLNEQGQLNPRVLGAIRGEMNQAYTALRNAPEATFDAGFYADITKAAKSVAGAQRMMGRAGTETPNVQNYVQGLMNNPTGRFTPSDALDSIDMLRSQAKVAGRAGDTQNAKAFSSVAKAIEELMERTLNDPNQLSAFRAARTMLAKVHSVEDAMNPVTGEVSALALARQMANDVPLTGGLRKAAEFGTEFPKAARLLNEPVPEVTPLDMGVAAIAAAAAGPGAGKDAILPLLLPGLRPAARALVFSRLGQRLAVPSAPREPVSALNQFGLPGALWGGLPSLYSSSEPTTP